MYAMLSNLGSVDSPFKVWTQNLVFRNNKSLYEFKTKTLRSAVPVYFLNWLHPCQLPQNQCHTCDWMPSRFSLWVVQNWSSTLGPGWSPRSSTIPESFFRTFHICPDHWTIRVSIEYNKPRSSGQPVGLRETESGAIGVGKNGNMGFGR